MLIEGRQWFDHYLLQVPNGIDTKAAVEVSPDRWKGTTRKYTSPAAIANGRTHSFAWGSSKTIGPSAAS